METNFKASINLAILVNGMPLGHREPLCQYQDRAGVGLEPLLDNLADVWQVCDLRVLAERLLVHLVVHGGKVWLGIL